MNFHNVRQVARVTRYREVLPAMPPSKKHRELVAQEANAAGERSNDRQETDCRDAADKPPETAYLITSLSSEAASAERLLELCRGHWVVENLNHRQRDLICGEDACQMRTGNGPANRAILNNLALAVVFRSRCAATDKSLADTRARLQMQRSEAMKALTEP